MEKKDIKKVDVVKAESTDELVIISSSLKKIARSTFSSLLTSDAFKKVIVHRTGFTSNTDLNDIHVPGIYVNTTGNGENNSNFPHLYGIIIVAGTQSSYGTVQLHITSYNDFFYRIYWGGKWYPWKKITSTVVE